MALERALEMLLDEVRVRIARLRQVKRLIKEDLVEERARANSDECVAPVRREERASGECLSSNDGDSQPVDNHHLDQTERDA